MKNVSPFLKGRKKWYKTVMAEWEKWATRVLLPEVLSGSDAGSGRTKKAVQAYQIDFAENNFPILPEKDAEGHTIIQVGARQGYLHAFITAHYGE